MPPWGVFVCSLVIGSASGFVAFTRSTEPATWRAVASRIGGGGLLSMLLSMALWRQYGDTDTDIFFLIAISGICPLAGITAFDLAPAILQVLGKNGDRSSGTVRKWPRPDSDTPAAPPA